MFDYLALLPRDFLLAHEYKSTARDIDVWTVKSNWIEYDDLVTDLSTWLQTHTSQG